MNGYNNQNPYGNQGLNNNQGYNPNNMNNNYNQNTNSYNVNQNIGSQQSPYTVPSPQPAPIQSQSINNMQPNQSVPNQNMNSIPRPNNYNSMMNNNSNLNNTKPPKTTKKPKKEMGTTASVLATMIMMIIIFACIVYICYTLGYVSFNFGGAKSEVTSTNTTNSNESSDEEIPEPTEDEVASAAQTTLNTNVESLANWFKNQSTLDTKTVSEDYKLICPENCKKETLFSADNTNIFSSLDLDINDYDLTTSNVTITDGKVCVVLTANDTGSLAKATTKTVKSADCEEE